MYKMTKYLTLENLGWVILTIVSLMLGMGAVSKIVGTQEMVSNFEFMKLSDYRVLVGIGELVGVGLLLFPRTSAFGAILISCFMSGAVMAHLSLMGGQGVFSPIMVGLLAWVGYSLREYSEPSRPYYDPQNVL